MLSYKSRHVAIYFGGAKDAMCPSYYLNLPDRPLLSIKPFDKLKQSINVQHLVFAHQVHGDQGVIIDKFTALRLRSFKYEADFLMTGMPGVGIGVMTADCLPIVFHDEIRKVIAVTHAGWRGSVLSIAVRTLEKMKTTYGCDPQDIAVFFGPSAKACCYQVDNDFIKNLSCFEYKDQVIKKHEIDLFFNLVLFNKMQLEVAGISPSSINELYNLCTICDDSFCSYRRQGTLAARQMTVVCLT